MAGSDGLQLVDGERVVVGHPLREVLHRSAGALWVAK